MYLEKRHKQCNLPTKNIRFTLECSINMFEVYHVPDKCVNNDAIWLGRGAFVMGASIVRVRTSTHVLQLWKLRYSDLSVACIAATFGAKSSLKMVDHNHSFLCLITFIRNCIASGMLVFIGVPSFIEMWRKLYYFLFHTAPIDNPIVAATVLTCRLSPICWRNRWSILNRASDSDQ